VLYLLLCLQSYFADHEYRRLPLKAVALGDAGTYVICCEDGSYLRSSGLSKGLSSALQKTKKQKAGLAVVSLGRNEGSACYSKADDPSEVWFLQRETGWTYMGQGCEKSLYRKWKKAKGSGVIGQVSFAPNKGWYAFRSNGGASWEGLPESLDQELAEKWDAEGGVAALSVGHNGEWFVLYSSGAYAWNAVHPILEELLQSGNSSFGPTGEVEWVELGPNGTYVALFEYYTAWRGSQALADDLLSCL
jgi:hypothetical protein